MNLDFARTESPNIAGGSVRDVIADYQSDKSESHRARCAFCFVTLPIEQLISRGVQGHLCVKCNKVHQRRIEQHSKRVQYEMELMGYSSKAGLSHLHDRLPNQCGS